jgi:hypothetical protein
MGSYMPGRKYKYHGSNQIKARPLARWYIRSRDQGQTRAGPPDGFGGRHSWKLYSAAAEMREILGLR